MLIQLVIQFVGSVAHFQSNFTHYTHNVPQFTQHKQLLHSRISHNKHEHGTVTSCHDSVFICCCTLAFLSLLFIVLLSCVFDSLSVFRLLHPFLLQFLPLFSHFFFCFSHHPMFLPPTSLWLSMCSLTSCNSCLFYFLSLSFNFFLSVSVFLTLAFSSSSLVPSIQKRTSIPTVHSGATPSAPWLDSGLHRTVVC